MTDPMPRLKRALAIKLFPLLAIIALACGVSQTTASPSLEPSPTALATISIPEEGRPLFEAWELIQRDFVENDLLDSRALSDGVILEILDITESTDLSLVEARDMVIKLRNVGGFFDGSGGDELRDAYEVWAYAYQNFVQEGEITVSDLNEAAINGIVDTLDDPYTIFLDEEALRLDQEDLQGTFEGIGAFVETNEDGFIIVIAPIPDTPADRAGILPGDLLLAVDGAPTNEMTLPEAIARDKGASGHTCYAVGTARERRTATRHNSCKGCCPGDQCFSQSRDRGYKYSTHNPVHSENAFRAGGCVDTNKRLGCESADNRPANQPRGASNRDCTGSRPVS